MNQMYLDFLINPRFDEVNRLLVLFFGIKEDRTVPIKMKDYNIMIDGLNLFDQPVKNNNIW